MSNILITGATGNIGIEVIRYLSERNTSDQVIAGVRNINKAKELFKEIPTLQYVPFDFENLQSFESALEGIDTIFLLRPPHLADVEKYFRPLIIKLKEKGIRQVVFLSVQGADKSKVIPHNKIERLIKEYMLDFVFLRPAYFMQNLITTLLPDIVSKRQIILPAGKAKFNWIDIKNIAEIAAIVLTDFTGYTNQAFDITGNENLSFGHVVKLMNECIDNTLTYKSVSPLKFYRIKKKEGLPKAMIVVMTLLHFLPRLQKPPRIVATYKKLTGREPTTLAAFIDRERKYFL
jgi:uncharacterized protein YbjT (DUF2867 family)